MLTAHNALGARGFVWFVGLTAFLIALPLFSILGTAVFWALLPFLIAGVALLWWGLRRSWNDRAIVEELRLWDDCICLERYGPRALHRTWQANPYWVRAELHTRRAPVPDYLTLSGGPRTVELGAFLTPEERRALKALLDCELDRQRRKADHP